jgi:hypothetical protein
MEKWAYNVFVLWMCLLMGSGEEHKKGRVDIYSHESRKTDYEYIVQKAVIIRIQSMSSTVHNLEQ